VADGGRGGAVAMLAGAVARLVGQLICAGAIFSAGVLGWYNCISAAMCQWYNVLQLAPHLVLVQN
jgi:hypothetical protein